MGNSLNPYLVTFMPAKAVFVFQNDTFFIIENIIKKQNMKCDKNIRKEL